MRSIIAGTLRHLKMNRTLRVVELGSPKPRISDINYFITHGNNFGTNAASTLSAYIRELVDSDNHLMLFEEAYLYYLDEVPEPKVTSDSAQSQSTCAFPTQSRMLPRIDEGGIPNWLPPTDEGESAAPAEEPPEQPTRPLLDSRWGKSRRSVEELESKRASKGYYSLPIETRREVLRLHRHLGHIPPDSFARVLRHAGAREDIVK